MWMGLATFAEVAPDQDAAGCLAKLHELEDEDARSGDYSAFPAAAELLGYLAAAQALGRAAADRLVIEDSAAGVEAGVRARMTVWSVGPVAVDGAHRHHQSLEAAVPDIRKWLAE
jgi:mannitol-1-/sugar-/sorbitol-6-phosphatase